MSGIAETVKYAGLIGDAINMLKANRNEALYPVEKAAQRWAYKRERELRYYDPFCCSKGYFVFSSTTSDPYQLVFATRCTYCGNGAGEGAVVSPADLEDFMDPGT